VAGRIKKGVKSLPGAGKRKENGLGLEKFLAKNVPGSFLYSSPELSGNVFCPGAGKIFPEKIYRSKAGNKTVKIKKQGCPGQPKGLNNKG
jgi:hypothetical protein